MIREDETNCNMLQTLRSGRDFFAAMKRASAASMLQDQLRAKLENTAAGTQPDRCDQRTWHGTSAPRGYNPAACQAAATELRKPFTGTSAQHDMPPIDGGAVPAESPFSDDSTSETEDGAVFHERQRAAGRHLVLVAAAVAVTGCHHHRRHPCTPSALQRVSSHVVASGALAAVGVSSGGHPNMGQH